MEISIVAIIIVSLLAITLIACNEILSRRAGRWKRLYQDERGVTSGLSSQVRDLKHEINSLENVDRCVKSYLEDDDISMSADELWDSFSETLRREKEKVDE